MIRLALVLPILALLAAGCDGGEAQLGFEERAAQPPSGIVRTDATGTILQDDPDDWQTAPVYAGRFSIVATPFPNPVRRSESVTITFRIFGANAFPSGVRLVTLLPPTGANRRTVLVQNLPDARTDGLYGFGFTVGQTFPQAGLYRLYVLDGFGGGIVSYGDLEVQ